MAINSSSLKMLTPRDSALLRLDPAFSPASKKSVFFEIDPDTLPPAASMSCLNSGRGRLSVPVITKVLPAMGESSDWAADFLGS